MNDENPWADAANDESWSKSAGLTRNSNNNLNTSGRNSELLLSSNEGGGESNGLEGFGSNNSRRNNNNDEYYNDDDIDIPPTQRCTGFSVRVWNSIDCIVGLLLVIYSFVLLAQQQRYNQHHHHHRSLYSDNAYLRSVFASADNVIDSHYLQNGTVSPTNHNGTDNSGNDSNNNNNNNSNNESMDKEDNLDLFITFTIALGSLLLFRSVMVSISVRSEMMKRIGLRISAMTSPITAIMYLVLCIWIFAAPNSIIHYLHSRDNPADDDDAHNIFWQLHILYTDILTAQNSQIIAIVMLAFCLLECVRWQLLTSYRKMFLDYDYYLLMSPNLNTQRRGGNKPNRPWWWQRSRNIDDDNNNIALTTPLMPSSSNQQQDTSPSWFNFSFFGRSGGDNDSHNPRDDASVDFASVQEDWASRSQEDPYWWARDDNDTGIPGGIDFAQSTTTTPRDQDAGTSNPSWAS